ncbi:MAG: aminopeptidase [Kouleothrix sp.]|nr:aminopeptidase [Kouleothrix sp.]
MQQALRQYADLAVRVGLNLRAGQRLIVRAPLQTAPLVRLIAASAYRAGASLVDVQWRDDELTLIRFQEAPRDSFEQFPSWQAQALLESAERGDAFLSIVADDPDLLKGQDPALVGIAQKTAARQYQPFQRLMARNATNWLVISAPIESWAAKIFPHEPPEQRETRLWEAIFRVCRIGQADPVAAWQAHVERLVATSDYLNHRRYAALKYRAPGTDLTIGLPDGHRWASGRVTSENGIAFIPNMPTEEVFTLPHRGQVSGVVSSTRPLSLDGALIDDFSLTFAEGRVVDVRARSGESHLRRLIETDEGAGRLGEVALVPHSSPIAQSGLLFYNTLFDENAASHLALGRAYRFSLAGGEALSEEQFGQAGGNTSLIHTDFMIGSGQMDVDGVRQDGTVEPLMRAGEWAFEL